MTKTPRTVRTVTTKILKPVRAAAVGSATAVDLIESLTGFIGTGRRLRRGRRDVRRAVDFGFLRRPERFARRRRRPGPFRAVSGFDAEFLRLALTRLPPRPPAPGTGLWLDVDERGVFEPEQDCLLFDLAEDLRRPRLGTVQLDVVRDGSRSRGRCSHSSTTTVAGTWRRWAAGRPSPVLVAARERGRLAEFVEGRVPEHA